MYQDNTRDRQGTRRTQLRAALMVFLSGTTGSLYAQTPTTHPVTPQATQQVDVRLLPPLPIQIGRLRGAPEGASAITAVGTALRDQGAVRANPYSTANRQQAMRPVGPLQLAPLHEDANHHLTRGNSSVMPVSESSDKSTGQGSGHAHFTFSDQDSGDAGRPKETVADRGDFAATFSLSDRIAENSPQIAPPIGLNGIPELPAEESPVLEPMRSPAALLRVAPRSPLVASAPIEFESITSSELPASIDEPRESIAASSELVEFGQTNSQSPSGEVAADDATTAAVVEPDKMIVPLRPLSIEIAVTPEAELPVAREAVSEPAEKLAGEPSPPTLELPTSSTSDEMLPSIELTEEDGSNQTAVASPFANLEPVARGGKQTVAKSVDQEKSDDTGLSNSSLSNSSPTPSLSAEPVVARRESQSQPLEDSSATKPATPSSGVPSSVMRRGPFADVVTRPLQNEDMLGARDASEDSPVVAPAAEIYRPRKPLVIDTTTIGDSEGDSGKQDDVAEECFETKSKTISLVQIAETSTVSPNEPVKRVQLQDREVCDAVLVNPYKLLLIGRKAGTTKLAIWYGQNSEPEVREIRVVETQPSVVGASLDAVANRLTETIAATYPGCRVIVVPEGEGLTVRGRASDSKSAVAIMRLVRSACLKTVNDQLEVR